MRQDACRGAFGARKRDGGTDSAEGEAPALVAGGCEFGGFGLVLRSIRVTIRSRALFTTDEGLVASVG